MRRKLWLMLAVAALAAVSFAASGSAARRATDPRLTTSTHALDYLHAHQTGNGGFINPENTAWALLGMIAKRERQGASAWRIKGISPFTYLQRADLASYASSGAESAPVYYSRLIMAYVATRQSNAVADAGSKGINLFTELKKYQDMSDTSANKGSFSSIPGTANSAIHTTSWAVLAMFAFLDDASTDPNYMAARDWLAGEQNADGGFSSSVRGQPSNVVDTALAIQALKAGADQSGWSATLAESFLLSVQNAEAGFPYAKGADATRTDATAAAIQAIIALGGQPSDWKKGARTPYGALSRLQSSDGSYGKTDRLGTLAATCWALIAQDQTSKPFTTYPKQPVKATNAFLFRPEILTVQPKNKATFKTHVVLIKATYTDREKGTGIRASACRLYVDGHNRSRPAAISSHGMHLLLKEAPNGEHTFKIVLRDRAGNSRTVERKFTVQVATPTPIPTRTPPTRPTYFPTTPATRYPTSRPTAALTPTTTPYPSGSTTPYPYSSGSPLPTSSPIISGSPIPSASASPSPGAGGGGSAAGFVGGTLLAMLPIGAVVSYLLLHRREELLGTASQGAVLAGGGSAWERFKRTLAKSKDLTRPSSRE